MHEAYQYFRGRYKSKHKDKSDWTHIKQDEWKEKEDLAESTKFEKITMGVQHKGRVSAKEANKLLREFWPKNIVKKVEVKRRVEVADRSPDYQPLWVVVTMATGHSFENWLDWPLCEDNWPNQFDKGLFKEDSEWV